MTNHHSACILMPKACFVVWGNELDDFWLMMFALESDHDYVATMIGRECTLASCPDAGS
jgi:hypothetical protein